MKLQLDTTVIFHCILDRCDDPIMLLYGQLKKQADSVHASTFTKKEFAFSLISDCCSFQAKLFNTKSFLEAYTWIDKYSYFKKRFGPRIHEMLAHFILEHYGNEILECDVQTKNRVIAEHLLEYLRLIIPELWERFDNGLTLPLDDRTKCAFAYIGPVEEGRVFRIRTKTARHPCDGSEGCSLESMLKGKDSRRRALSLLKALQGMPDSDEKKTRELKQIQRFLQEFFESGRCTSCYEMCNKGIGDMVIALETLPDRTLVTTNTKEYEIICTAISQNYYVISTHANRSS